MYKLLYCFIFRVIEKRNPDPQFGAITYVWLTQFVHVAFILSLFKKTLNIDYPELSEIYFLNKLYFAPIAILWLILTYRYWKKKSDKILSNYDVGEIVTLKNAVIVFASLIIPLVLMILMLKK